MLSQFLMPKKKRSNFTLGECINELKRISSSIPSTRTYRPTVTTVAKYREILRLIDILEVPELLCEENGNEKN